MLKQVGSVDSVPRDDLLNRIDRLRHLMADGGIDFAFMVQNVDRFYFTGTIGR
jgi:Xaa-Pro aminopeptidase